MKPRLLRDARNGTLPAGSRGPTGRISSRPMAAAFVAGPCALAAAASAGTGEPAGQFQKRKALGAARAAQKSPLIMAAYA